MGRASQTKPARLSEKLLQIRTALGLSQNGLIRHFGLQDSLTQADVSAFERGVRIPSLPSFRGESAFTTWLHRLTANQVLMHFRRSRARRERVTEDGELPHRATEGGGEFNRTPVLDRIALNEAIAKLPRGYRTVFVLYDVEGLEHLEIAHVLSCSVGTSKSQLHKARMKLRQLLKRQQQSAGVETENPSGATALEHHLYEAGYISRATN